MLTVAKLLKALEGLDPGAPVVIGTIEGATHDAAYAEHREFGGTAAAYICGQETPRPAEPPAAAAEG